MLSASLDFKRTFLFVNKKVKIFIKEKLNKRLKIYQLGKNETVKTSSPYQDPHKKD